MLREWVAIGYLLPDDEVRLADQAEWSRVAGFPELLAAPPDAGTNEALAALRHRARERTPVGPRASAYLARLGCPFSFERLNRHSAFEWVRILEELHPQRVDANEHWAAEEESQGRVPSNTPGDATREQLAALQARGLPTPPGLSRLEARRLLSGPPTEGQLRRLAFYGIELPAGVCAEEAAERIDRHMRENWHTEEAYQASRRKLTARAAGSAPAAEPLKLRVPAAATGDGSPSAAYDPFARDPLLSTRPVPGRSAVPVRVYVVGGILAALVAWWLLARRPATTPPRAAPEAAAPAGDADLSLAAQLARSVTVLEAPNQALGERLRQSVMEMTVTGIVEGAEPRVAINGRLLRVGDVVEAGRGVVLLRIDAPARTLVVGDAAGTIVQRALP